MWRNEKIEKESKEEFDLFVSAEGCAITFYQIFYIIGSLWQ